MNQAGRLGFVILLVGKFEQKRRNIPLAAAAARQRASLPGNGVHIQPLLEQALNIAPRRAAALA